MLSYKEQFQHAITVNYPLVKFHGDIGAPNDHKALLEHKAVLNGVGSLPVFNGASDSSIYKCNDANFLFRVQHDLIHLQHNLSFTLENEIKVATIQADQLSDLGYFETSNLVYLDIVAQAIYYSIEKKFVSNQVEFMLLVLFFCSAGDTIEKITVAVKRAIEAILFSNRNRSDAGRGIAR